MSIHSNGKPAATDDEATLQNRIDREEHQESDDWDLQSLRISQDFAAGLGVGPAYLTIACRKPHDQEFIRVRSGPEWRLEVGMFFDRNSRGDAYIVKPSMCGALGSTVAHVCLFTAMTSGGELFMWAQKLRQADGKQNDWFDSALDAAKEAERYWIRMSSNMTRGRYETCRAMGKLKEPVWPPDWTFRDIVRRCFQDRMIDDHSHPILKSLRGEV